MDKKKCLKDVNIKFLEFVKLYNQLEIKQHRIGGLTTSEVHMLVIIGKNKHISPINIAERLSISRSAVTQMLNKLTVKGLIDKKISVSKNSSYELSLTRDGEKIYQCHKLQQEKIESEIYSVLQKYPENFYEQLLDLMNDIQEKWNEIFDE